MNARAHTHIYTYQHKVKGLVLHELDDGILSLLCGIADSVQSKEVLVQLHVCMCVYVYVCMYVYVEGDIQSTGLQFTHTHATLVST